MKEVRLAYLQTPVTIPGLFTSMTTLSAEKTPSLKMLWHEGVLMVSTGNITGIIPSTNIKICVFKDNDGKDNHKRSKD